MNNAIQQGSLLDMPALGNKEMKPSQPVSEKKMSRLEELIADLCPNGVEYKKLGECILKTSNIKWKNETSFFYYIDLSSVDRDTHKITETTKINSDNAPSRAQQIVNQGDILFGTTRPLLKRYCQITEEYHGQVCSTGFCVLRPDLSMIVDRWIYHIISSADFMGYVEKYQQGASYPSISDGDIKNYKIPVPPLPVQEEIVRILDTFSELTAELTAELTKRKQQYQYYRNNLIDFSENRVEKSKKLEELIAELCPNGVEYKRLNEVFHIKNGYTPSKAVSSNWKNGTIPWFRMEDIRTNGRVLSFSIQNVSESAIKSSGLFPKNSIIISTTATIGEHALITVDFIANQQLTCLYRKNDFINKINMKYIYHYFFIIDELCKKMVHKSGGMPIVDMEKFKKISIPVPPLLIQKEIVAILDRFDDLCNDLTSGLPAEIEARKKQYEYYRDKLLTFKEAV